jgi:DnaJ domain/Type III restriction enzyme, res subunit
MSDRDSSEDNDAQDAHRKYTCIGNVANWSKSEAAYIFDKRDAFFPEVVKEYTAEASPKLNALLDKIAEVDSEDMKNFGHNFKHMIFTGISNPAYGLKIVASVLISNGFELAFHASANGALAHKPLETLEESEAPIFTVLASKPLYGKPMTTYFKKRTLEIFNMRDENNHGDLIRFIVVDGGFREGIDLFDIKYIHLFEPTPIRADEKQAIGRGTRLCGQKGIYFDPKRGWPLHVYRYEVSVDSSLKSKLDADTFMKLQMKYSDLDPRLFNFGAAMDAASMKGAVDAMLTQPIHDFKLDSDRELALVGGADTDCPASPMEGVWDQNMMDGTGYMIGGKTYPVPTEHMSSAKMYNFIKNNYRDFMYKHPKMENGCVQKGGRPRIATFTPTQDFLRNYFRPDNFAKGMLAHHSPGAGKTCSGIAVASSSFEKEGYTILWVTRHTLKADLSKNQFDIVCNVGLQEKIKDGQKISKKSLSSNWLKPISYKQFSNMLLKKNSLWFDMVKRNGEEDPLHKTLLIIDEAHKLYAPDTPAAEKPNMTIMENMIQNSFQKSGKDSVRMLFMTGTPYTKSPMEMIQLLNLMRPKALAFPDTYDLFAAKYLDQQGSFTTVGEKQFFDDISGYISYLDRSLDARSFAYPVIENVVVPMSMKIKRNKEDKFNKYVRNIKQLKAEVKQAKKEDKVHEKECTTRVKNILAQKKLDAAEATDEAKQQKKDGLEDCKTAPKNEQKDCKDRVKHEYERIIEEIARELETARAAFEAAKQACAEEQPFAKEKMRALEEMEREYEVIKAEYTRLRMEAAEITNVIRTLRQEKEGLEEEVAKKKKVNKERVKELRARLKVIKGELIKLREQINRLKVLQTLNRIKVGVKFPPDVSQQTNLMSNCFKEPKPREPTPPPRPPPRRPPSPPPPQARPGHTPRPPRSPPPADRSPRKEHAPKKKSPPYTGPSVADFRKLLEENGKEGARKAYLKLAIKYHPDKHLNSPEKNQAIFKVLQKAWTETQRRFGI